nr:imidazole glycerol phosphate synthase subunit HisH [uncultured Sphingomonas sp.]
MNIAVIDYGMGNIGSICNMLKYVDASYIVTSEFREIETCSKIILPGVGHFDLAMQNLAQRDLIEPLHDLVLGRKVPILGICLGMQLLCSASEEGRQAGLGYIDAQARKFRSPAETGLKVPHMGWSEVHFDKQNALSDQLGESARFYFVHSYAVTCNDASDVWGTTRYGETFVSAFVRDNIAGVQFHPEKSHKFGIQLFRNFVGSFGA